jgi:hypothetical protein
MYEHMRVRMKFIQDLKLSWRLQVIKSEATSQIDVDLSPRDVINEIYVHSSRHFFPPELWHMA